MSACHGGHSRMHQRGVAGLMAMLFLLVVVGFSAVTLLNMSSSDLHDTTAQNDGVAALFAAETGIERASRLYSIPPYPCDATLLPAPAPAAPMPVTAGGTRGTFQSTAVIPAVLAGPPVRCRLQVIGRVGNTTRTIQADLTTALSDIALISTSRGTKNNINAAPMTWNHDIPAATAGVNRVVLVAVSLRRSGGTEAVVIGPQTTYGPLRLISVGGVDHPTDGVRVEWLLALNPPTGNSQVSVEIAPGARATGRSIAFSGVDQAAPIDAVAVPLSGNLPTDKPELAVTTVTDKAWVVDSLAVRLGATATRGAAQTQPAGWNTQVGAGNTGVRGAGSYKTAQSPAGSVSMAWTVTGAAPVPLTKGWVYSALALRPAPRVYVLNWNEM
jgi:hypothetical protein